MKKKAKNIILGIIITIVAINFVLRRRVTVDTREEGY